jgi:toxin YoeB
MHSRFVSDLQFWVDTDPRRASRVLRLVEEVLRDPFHGIGKPEPLRGRSGFWSRRIDEEHRLTYRVADTYVDFLQARFHYDR